MTLAVHPDWPKLVRAIRADVASSAITTCLVVAHPDDEVIGAGATILPHAARCTIVHVTDGAPRDPTDAHAAGFSTRDAYAAERRAEAARAIALARSHPWDTIELDIEDQRASHCLPALARHLATLLARMTAPIVLTHPYEGGHPDHDAACFAVHAARELLRRDGASLPLIEFTSYHLRNGETIHSDFLHHARAGPTVDVVLTPREQALKRQMFQRFRTQQEVLRWFPVDVERFRLAPRYDFGTPPHAGPLNYERYPWGMTGTAWRKLAGEAQQELGWIT